MTRLGRCPGWSASSLGAHVILLVLSCGGSSDKTRFGSTYETPSSEFVSSSIPSWQILTAHAQRRFRASQHICAFSSDGSLLDSLLVVKRVAEVLARLRGCAGSLWTVAGHAQLKFVMTECSKAQIRLTRPIYDMAEFCQNLGLSKYWSNESWTTYRETVVICSMPHYQGQ